ncbi:MAG: alpha/beta fold hydrolase [Proteobacteria bacterium]|nr:alpha/beta fold hydrolase [Pseudomonadota bacterium]
MTSTLAAFFRRRQFSPVGASNAVYGRRAISEQRHGATPQQFMKSQLTACIQQAIAIALIFCCATIVAPVQASNKSQLAGTWVGHWIREGATVDVTMRFSKAQHGFEGSFDSEGLRVVGIPMQKIILSQQNVSWEVVSDSSTETYAGQLHGDALSGQFKQGDATGRFSFTRLYNAPSSPKREEITFLSGDVRLSGTIFVPTGTGPHPGIVFLHGSGAEGRWASNYLANRFARKGFAALTFDKQGVGKSGGDWQQAGFEELAADAAAAVDALSAKAYVAPGKVGIHGHSQGGMLAPMVAASGERVAFVIASAGTGRSMRETETYSVENSLGVKNMSPAEAQEAHEFVNAIMETAFGGEPYEHAVEVWEKLRHRPWTFKLPPKASSYWSSSRKTAAYDAPSYWRQVSAPTLLVFGDADERVPARASAASIAEAYLNGRGTSFKVMFFPGADHTFRVRSKDAHAFPWPTTASGYPDALVNWAEETVGLPFIMRATTRK